MNKSVPTETWVIIIRLFVLAAFFSIMTTSLVAADNRRSKPLAKISVEISSNIVFVPVNINGQGPYWFVLDTGFQNCVIEQTLAKSMGLNVGASQRSDAPGGQVEHATITGVSLKIAQAEIPKPTVSSLDVKQFEPFFGHHIDGILGYDLFQAYVVEIDYERKMLTLYESASFRYGGSGKPLVIDTTPQQPYVIATVISENGKRSHGRFELDTGSLDAVNLNLPFAKKHAIGEASKRTLNVHGRSLGGETTGLLLRLATLEMGEFRIPLPYSSIVEDDVDRAGQISAEVLHRFTLTFDYSRKRVYLQKNIFFNRPFDIDMAGWFVIAAEPSLNGRKVFLVMNDSPAADAGVKEGDEIISVDNRAVSTISLDGLRKMFKQSGANRRVRLRRDGKEFDILINLRKLL